MTTLYKVQKIESKTTKAGKPYKVLTLNDKFVSFFDEKDVKVPVQEGQMITCRIVQKGNFLNGYDIAITTESQVKTGVTPGVTPGATSGATPGATFGAIPNGLAENATKIPSSSSPTPSSGADIAMNLDNIIQAGKRLYRFDLKTASNGNKYLIINETFEDKKNSIMIFENHWAAFLEKFRQLTEKK